MFPSTRRYTLRLFILGTAMLFALACGGTTCDCVAPLDQPMPEAEKLYDAIQTRLAPSAFDFIEGNLAQIIGTFMEGGLVFEVPFTDASQEFCIWFLCITINIRICENGCTLTAEIVDAGLTRVSPDTLSLDALVNLSGTITMDGTFDCDIPIDIQNKPVHADVRLLIDGRDHLMSFDVQNLQLTLENSDYSITCDWGFLSDIGLGGVIDTVINWIAGLLTPLLNDQLGSQIDGFLDDALVGATCLACDFYTGGCPSGSSCDGDYCVQDGSCRINPLGVVGSLDLGELLADFSPGMQAEIDLFVAAGQWEDASVDPVVVNNGVELRLIGGVDTERHVCVPQPDPAEIPPNAPPPRLPFDDVVPGTADSYMVGIGVSDAFMDWFLYKAFLSGLLCLGIDTESTGGLLSSGTLAVMLGSLNTLTGGRNVPVRLQLVPNHVPYIEIGAGTFTEDADGNRIMDEPLINMFMNGLGIDFYVLIGERWARVVTLTQDVTLMLGLDFLPDNTILPVLDENSVRLDNVVATNYELLAEDPSALEELVPTLIQMFLPMLTGSLGAIELPPIEGFALDIEAVQGDLPRPGTDYYEYMAIYANLRMADARLPAPRRTSARVTAVRTPVSGLMSIWAPGGPQYPEVIVEVAADPGPEAEYSWRVDRGVWTPFQPGPRLTVHDPRLALICTHEIEVRSRTAGNYLTLDPYPVRLTVEIAPEDNGPRYYEPQLPGKARIDGLGVEPINQAMARSTSTEEEPLHVGCATTTGPGLGLLMLLGMAFWLRRKR